MLSFEVVPVRRVDLIDVNDCIGVVAQSQSGSTNILILLTSRQQHAKQKQQQGKRTTHPVHFVIEQSDLQGQKEAL